MKNLLAISLAVVFTLGLVIVASPPQPAIAKPTDIYVPGEIQI